MSWDICIKIGNIGDLGRQILKKNAMKQIKFLYAINKYWKLSICNIPKYIIKNVKYEIHSV